MHTRTKNAELDATQKAVDEAPLWVESQNIRCKIGSPLSLKVLFRRRMNLTKFRLAGALWLTGTLLIHALVFWNFREFLWKGYPDFTIYYAAGTMVRRGLGHQLYDNAKQYAIQREFASGVANRLGALPFNHPPFEAIFFTPLSCLSYHSAYLLWAAANLAILAMLPVLLRPHVSLLNAFSAPVWILMSLAFFPVFLALMQGQDTVLLLLLYALVFVSWRNGNLVSTGAWLACGLFKFHLVLPFLALWLIAEKDSARRGRFACGFGTVTFVLVSASIALIGFREAMFYPRYVLGLEASGGGGSIYPLVMPNLRGLLSLISPHLPHLNWLVISLSAIVLVAAAWVAKSRDLDATGFALFAFATVLVSYHTLVHDLSILVLPLLLLAAYWEEGRVKGGWSRWAIMTGGIALIFSPLQVILLIRYSRYAWIGLAVLLCFAGVSREQILRPRKCTDAGRV